LRRIAAIPPSLLGEDTFHDAVDPKTLELAIQAFFEAYDCHNLALTIEGLEVISSIIGCPPFQPLNWALILDSGLVTCLVKEPRPDWPCELLRAHMICLGSILRYPPSTDLGQICERISQDDFLPHILGYSEWILPDLDIPYVMILSHVVRIYVPGAGDVLDRILAVQVITVDENTGVPFVHNLGQEILAYLCAVHAQEGFVSVSTLVKPMVYLRGYVEWALSAHWGDLTDEALVCLFDGLDILATLFPKWCLGFYALPLTDVDQYLRLSRQEVYSRLRRVLLRITETMAVFNPFLMKWTPDWLDCFCNADDPDSGIPGLEITTWLLTRSPVLNQPRLDVAFCGWFLSELPDAGYSRRISLLRLFCNVLSYAQHDGLDGQYNGVFLALCPLLDDCLSTDDIRELSALSLHILFWFVDAGYCQPEDLCSIPSLPGFYLYIQRVFGSNHTDPIQGRMTEFIAWVLARLTEFQPELAVMAARLEQARAEEAGVIAIEGTPPNLADEGEREEEGEQ
jgi:hypothetical protein